MQNTNLVLGPTNKNKKPLKHRHHHVTSRNSKSVLPPSFVASAPVRRQLPPELTSENFASVERMRAFVVWAAKQRFTKSLEVTVKKATYNRYALRGNKHSRSRLFVPKRGLTELQYQRSLSTSRQTFRSFTKPTIRSMWSFLTQYKQATCLRETRRWRARQHQILLQYSKAVSQDSCGPVKRRAFKSKVSHKSKFGPGLMTFRRRKPETLSRKYATRRAIYLAYHRSVRGVSPAEAKVRLLLRRFKRWHLRRPRKMILSTCLVKEYARVCGLLRDFISCFDSLKKFRKNSLRLRQRLNQVMLAILPKKYSASVLKKLDAKTRYNYIVVWRFTSFLWRFIASDFAVLVPELTPAILPKHATPLRLIKGPTRVQMRRKRASLFLRTSWLTYGNKQAAMFARDCSLKYKKEWANYVVKNTKFVPFWRRRKQMFRINPKVLRKQRKAIFLLRGKVVLPTLFVPACAFPVVMKRLLTTKTAICQPKVFSTVHSKHRNVFKSTGQGFMKLQRKHKQPLPADVRRARGRAKTKTVLKTSVLYRLFLRRFWRSRRRYLKIHCLKFFRKYVRAAASLRSQKLLLAAFRSVVRLKLRRHRAYESRLRYLTRGQVRYMSRKRKKQARKQGASRVRLTVKRTLPKKKKVLKRKLPVAVQRLLQKRRLLSALCFWLSIRRSTIKHRIGAASTSVARTAHDRQQVNKLLVNSLAFTGKSSRGLNRTIALRKRVGVLTRKKVALLSLHRVSTRLISRRITKRAVNRGFSRRMLLPTSYPCSTYPTTFDSATMRPLVGKAWRKKTRRVRAIRAWVSSYKKINTQLAHLFPFVGFRVNARKSGTLLPPKVLARSVTGHPIETPAALTGSFPFSHFTDLGWRQELVRRARVETPALRALVGRPFFAPVFDSRYLLNSRSQASASHYPDILAVQREQLAGFIQDFDRLDAADKAAAYVSLKRGLSLNTHLNQSAAFLKLKLKKRTGHLQRDIASSRWEGWLKKLSRRRQQISRLKQQFPRKGSRQRRYKRGLQKQIKYLLKSTGRPRKGRPGSKGGTKLATTRDKNYASVYNKSSAASNYAWRGAVTPLLKIKSGYANFKKIYVARLVQGLRANSAWRGSKRQNTTAFLSAISYLSPLYRLRARLFAKAGYLASSNGGSLRQKKTNRIRKQLAGRLYAQRRADAVSWNRKNQPFKRTAHLGYEEKFKRNLHKLNWAGAMNSKSEYMVGSPAASGQRRTRRVFVPKFNKNRWWKPVSVALPHYHPYSLYKLGVKTDGSPVTHFRMSNDKKFSLPTQESLAYREHCNSNAAGDAVAYLQNGGQLNALPSPAPARRSVFTAERASRGNRGWRLVGASFVKTTGSSDPSALSATVTTALASLEQCSPHFKNIWSSYAKKTSTRAAMQLRAYFIESAPYWLQERPLEKLVSTWTEREWANFSDFASGTRQCTHEAAENFKAQFLSSSRHELFIQAPNWWQDETTIRARLLFKFMVTGASPSTIIELLARAVSNRTLFSAQSVLGWQEKKLLIFSCLNTEAGARQQFSSAVLNTATAESNSFNDKPFTSLYYTWLNGVEVYLKKNRNTRSSQSYNELRGATITELGTERPRFPGTGRRKFTFDSLLRAHYTKVMPLRFRRVAGSRFQKIRPLVATRFTAQLPIGSATASTRRGQRRNQCSTLVYPTKRYRELYARRFNTPFVGRTVTAFKSRLATLPLKISFAHANRKNRRARLSYCASSAAQGESLLQYALRRRFVARNIRDLRKAGRRRRLSRPQFRPFWMQNRLARKRRRADRCNLYKLPFAGGYTPATSALWACENFAVQVSRSGVRAASLYTAGGEILTAPALLRYSNASSGVKTLRYGVAAKRWKRQHIVGYGRVKKIKMLRGKFRWRGLGRIRGRVRRLRKNARYSNKYYPQKWKLSLRTTKKTLQSFDAARTRFQYRFLQQTQPSMFLTPLHFRKRAAHVSVSAAEKERWRLHIQATRQRKYRRLTEQSEALTQLFPQLIGQIIEKKMAITPVSLQVAANLVHSIYWSLRVYLQHDFGRRKLWSRDDNVKKVLKLNQEITTASAERFFTLLELAQARYRFQPHCLHPGPSLLRGAAEWQRRFLPRFYELNLEDPQKYGHLTITPLKVFRAHTNCKKVGTWETRKIPGLMENRFTRLTTERHGKNSCYFENMLMTTRRLPVTAGYGAAATLRVVNPVGSFSARKSFFLRTFTTSTALKQPSVNNETAKRVVIRMAILNRKATPEPRPLSLANAATAHRSLKQVNLARIRAHQIAGSNDAGGGSIDIRLLRAKSPRNSEYLQRLSLASGCRQAVTLLNAFGSSTRIKSRQTLPVFRTQRASIRAVRYPLNENYWRKDAATWTGITRRVVLLRRRPTFLKVQGLTVKRILPKLVLRRLFVDRRVARARNSRFEFFPFQKNRAVVGKFQLSQARNNLRGQSVVVRQDRSILQFRTAENRSVFSDRTPSIPVILNQSIKLNFTAWNFLKRGRFDEKLREKLKQQQVEHKRKQRFYVRTRSDDAVLSAPKKQYRKVCLLQNKVRVGGNRGSLKRLMPSSQQRVRAYWRNKTRLTSLKKQTTRNLSSYFTSFSNKQRRNSKVLSAYANQVEKRRARTLFADRRPELWRDLTMRWTKKFRLLKRWLKGVKYSFKQEVWNANGQPVVPDVLFKLSRLRLRKLDWRESSDRFERQGLRHAFAFHPSERRHARWLESLMYRRALYSYQRGEYKRDQFPREQKSRKWLQRLRKLLYRQKLTNLYIKRRRWPTVRHYNQKLCRSIFHVSTSKAMLKRFRKLSRRKPAATGFEKSMVGFGDRLDVNLLLLNIAPTTFWAREIAPMGLFRVNGEIIRRADFRFTPGDQVELMWDKVQKLKVHFASRFRRHDKSQCLRDSSLRFPGNFAYSTDLRTAQYLRRPRMDDLAESSRVNARLFRWSRLDSGLGK